MYQLLKKIQSTLIIIIDFFHIPFKKFVPIDVFRYGVCGSMNTIFDWVLYFIVFQFVLKKQMVDCYFVTFTPHIAALFITFPFSFIFGFLLSKYISFRQSTIVGNKQLLRYAVVVAFCIVINYVCMKFFVEICLFYPTPSKMLTTVFTVLFSYFSQKHFTFKS